MAMPPFIQDFIDGPKLPKVVLGIVGLLVILGLGYYFGVSPYEADIAKFRARKGELQKEIAQARIAAADLGRVQRELKELEQRLVELRERLPNEKETPVVYRRLADAARESGLGVSLFQPRDPRPRDYVNEIPITMTAEGGYHQLGKFFEQVAALQRVVTVGEFKVTGLVKSRNTMKADLTLATYTYRKEGPAPARPGAPAPKAPAPKAALPTPGEARS
jgi:type IV pilus assembly protein PilO